MAIGSARAILPCRGTGDGQTEGGQRPVGLREDVGMPQHDRSDRFSPNDGPSASNAHHPAEAEFQPEDRRRPGVRREGPSRRAEEAAEAERYLAARERPAARRREPVADVEPDARSGETVEDRTFAPRGPRPPSASPPWAEPRARQGSARAAPAETLPPAGAVARREPPQEYPEQSDWDDPLVWDPPQGQSSDDPSQTDYAPLVPAGRSSRNRARPRAAARPDRSPPRRTARRSGPNQTDLGRRLRASRLGATGELLADQPALVLLGLAALGLAGMWAVVGLRMGALGPALELRLDAEGSPSSWGSPDTLWRLPLLATVATLMNVLVAWRAASADRFASRFMLAAALLVQVLAWLALIGLAW